MKKLHTIIRLLIIFSIIFFISNAVSASTRGIHAVSKKGKEMYLYKDYHALVVGVGNYDYWPDLRGSVRDAGEVAGSLKKMGMSVKLILNPDSNKLKAALNELTYGVGSEKNRAIIFFFSGHGETETLATGEKLGYIIPKDAPLPSRDRIGFINKAISMNQIETYALRIQSKHVLMLFDSCFSGSVFSSLKGIPTDITEKSNRPARQFITAGNENEQVPDESVFKTCLVQGINGEADANKDGYVTGSELGMYLDSSVVNYSNGCQHPQYGKIRHPKLDKGDFIIKLASSGAMATLSVRSNVSGARIHIDGIEMGQTPLVNFALSAGDHRVRVKKDGYESYEKSIHIEEDRSSSLYATLTPTRKVQRTGRLYVDTEPENARIRILNISPRYSRGMELKAGRYHVEVSKSGHETKKEWLDLAAGEDKYIDVRLVKTVVREGNVIFANVKEHLIKNFILGDLLVIQGTVVNKYGHPISMVKVRGKLLNAAKEVLDEVEFYCGNLLTDEELGHLTGKEIAEELSIQVGSDVSNDNIAPEGEIPFMIVFTNPPKEAVEFIVELAGMQPFSLREEFRSFTREADLRERDHYKKAWKELEAGNYNKSIYAQAFAKANGDADKTKALYIKMRVKQLRGLNY